MNFSKQISELKGRKDQSSDGVWNMPSYVYKDSRHIACISKKYDQQVNSWIMCINEMKLETLNINAYKKNSRMN